MTVEYRVINEVVQYTYESLDYTPVGNINCVNFIYRDLASPFQVLRSWVADSAQFEYVPGSGDAAWVAASAEAVKAKLGLTI